eukprot:m.130718 g.130718  ORF g.130718 m.130718 type:complete len:222 (+) comp9458_c1_seq3:130-795(+)
MLVWARRRDDAVTGPGPPDRLSVLRPKIPGAAAGVVSPVGRLCAGLVRCVRGVDRREQDPYIENHSYVVQHLHNPTDQLLVQFSDRKVDNQLAESYFTRMKENAIRKAILVTFNGVASLAGQIIDRMKTAGYHIQVFSKTELLVNVTKHQLVPQHDVLTDEEKAQLLARYKVSDDVLPSIQEDDPIARYYGLAKGQVIRITRRSETAGRYVTYRITIGPLL